MTLLSARTQDEAALMLCETAPSVVMIHLSLDDGSPLAVADFANYRRPDARVILLGGGGLMADGSLFAHVGNAHALISGDMPPTDLTALIAFHAGAASMMH
ncbi:hypothetical protein [Jannaschia rubra]|nr:hypothetical protein [Jannaschia rubra]